MHKVWNRVRDGLSDNSGLLNNEPFLEEYRRSVVARSATPQQLERPNAALPINDGLYDPDNNGRFARTIDL